MLTKFATAAPIEAVVESSVAEEPAVEELVVEDAVVDEIVSRFTSTTSPKKRRMSRLSRSRL